MNKHILLFIDNDIGDYKPIERAFGRTTKDLEIVFADTARGGLELMEERPVKAVFVNRTLPDMEGFEFLERVTKQAVHVPVIMMMEEADEGECVKAIKKGAQDCVVKRRGSFKLFPFVLERTLARFELGTEVSRMNKVIRRSKETWLAIIDGIEDYIFIVDNETKIFRTNKSLARSVGKHPRELIGKSLSDLFDDDASSIFDMTARSTVPRTEEKAIRDKYYLISSFPLHYNNMPLTICIMKDISEMKKMEEQLYHSYKLASLGLLISGIAHEINNPLTGIITYAEFLRMKTKDGEIDTGLKKILSGAERCKKVIENLLTFSRENVPSKSLESINDVIDRTIELRRYWLRTNDIEVVRIYRDVPKVLLDSQQIQHAILDVLMNAEQAIAQSGSHKGRITFTTKLDKKARKIVVTISDNGPGIPGEIISRIFDPFFTTKPVRSGTGLGLSIAHGIITKHGGDIRVESSENEGATFFITLPAQMKGKE